MLRHLGLATLMVALGVGSLAGCVVGSDLVPSTDNGGGGGSTPDPDQGPAGPDGGAAPGGTTAFVLVHGFGGSADSWDPAIVQAFASTGHPVFRANLPVDSVAAQAAVLAQQVDGFMQQSGATRVHLIAHSMGGLDSRYLIAKLGYASRVASLTTMSTPHRGTPLADLALGLTTSSDGTASDALGLFTKLAGSSTDPEALHRALVDLSEAAAPAFNASVPDAPGVAYRSYGGFSTPDAISNPHVGTACTVAGGLPVPPPDEMRGTLVLAAPIVAHGTDRDPNDGVVAVASARWTGFAGCLSTDHLDETDAPGPSGPTFDTVAFYHALAVSLTTP